jgi:sugar lactone lactonase YvrE
MFRLVSPATGDARRRPSPRPATLTIFLAAAVCLITPALASAATERIFVTDPGPFPPASEFAGLVMRVHPTNGVRTLVSDDATPQVAPFFTVPFRLALEANGDILVADRDTPFDSAGRVIRVDPATGFRTLVSSNDSPEGGPGLQEPYGIALEANGDILVADTDAFPGGGVIRIDPVTGVRTTVSEDANPSGDPGFLLPVGLAVEANGDILVVDRDAGGLPGFGAVIRVDPATGARTLVSSNSSPAGGPSFLEPVSIAVEANGDILVGQAGQLLRVDPATGARTLVSSNSSPAGGPSLNDPWGLTVEPDGDILVADTGTAAVIRVDPVTGARTSVSSNTTPAGDPMFSKPSGIAAVTVTNQPPDCSPTTASPSVIATTPKGNFVTIALQGASDPDADTLSFHIDSVTQDEPVFGDSTSPDAQFTAAGADSTQVKVRAERDTKGDGRVYRIAFTVSDGAASCSSAETVSVPRKKGKAAVDSAPPSYDSFTGAVVP